MDELIAKCKELGIEYLNKKTNKPFGKSILFKKIIEKEEKQEKEKNEQTTIKIMNNITITSNNKEYEKKIKSLIDECREIYDSNSSLFSNDYATEIIQLILKNPEKFEHKLNNLCILNNTNETLFKLIRTIKKNYRIVLETIVKNRECDIIEIKNIFKESEDKDDNKDDNNKDDDEDYDNDERNLSFLSSNLNDTYKEKLNIKYINYYLKESFDISKFSLSRISIPSIEKQEEVIKILETNDLFIETLKNTIRYNRQVMKQIFQ